MMSSRNALIEDFEQVISALKSGMVKSSCMITHRSSLVGMVAEFEAWTRPGERVLKAMVTVD